MKAPPNDASSVEYDMGYGADEFGNVLTGPFSGDQSPYQCEMLARHHWQITQKDSDLTCSVRVYEKPPRKLGLFNLPVLSVQFEMEKSNPAGQDLFFKRFFKYFHKGGG